MLFKNVVIESMAYALPNEVYTSEAIEDRLAPIYERLKLPQGRLELMTGIQQRHHWPLEMLPSEAASKAGQNILKKTQFSKNNIDLLIHSSVCRDRLEPATAAYVHHLLDLGPDAQIMDVSNACLGFLNAMLVAAGIIQSGVIKTALIVSGENGRSLLENTINQLLGTEFSRKEIKPFFANLTIGSGAVAAILSHDSIVKKPMLRMGASVVETDSSVNNLCEGGNSDNALDMRTDSEQLLEAGIAVAKRAWKKFLDIDAINNIDHLICHQVGKQHQKQLYEALGLNVAKDFSTYQKLGNVGSVSVPITLAKAFEAQVINENEEIALLGIGSGLCSIMMALQS